MKKRLFMFATAALMLAACSNDGEVAVNNGAQLQSGSGIVAFDTYTSSATKAGVAGIMTTEVLKTEGFGVFAMVSDAAYTPGIAPNFMYNQYVHYTDAWTYEPLKYWPNETENDPQTSSNALATISTDIDKLSFFAYAPFVASADAAVDAAKGKLKDVTYDDDPAINNANTDEVGIQAVIANTGTVDPWVRYAVASNPSESVDLLWGVAPAGGLQYTAVNGTNINVAEGKPLKDLIKPAKDQKIKFLFKHALARIGLTVVAAVDQIAAGGTLKADETRIAVKSVNITDATATKQLKMLGTLNLNNGTSAGTANWIHKSGDIDFTISNAAGGGLNPNIAYNDAGPHDTWNTGGDWTGVTTAEKPVIAKDGTGKDQYFMVIPGNANTDVQVQITYYVITKDDKLAGGYSSVENVITKKVTVPSLSNNKAYNLKLVLGLTSVKLEAEVADWQVDGSNEVYLPQNAAE